MSRQITTHHGPPTNRMNQLQTEQLPVPDEPLKVPVREVERQEGEEVRKQQLKGEGSVGCIEKTEEDVVGGESRVSIWEEDRWEFGLGVERPGRGSRGGEGGVVVLVGVRVNGAVDLYHDPRQRKDEERGEGQVREGTGEEGGREERRVSSH